jgi:hypothetical protein
MFLDGLNDVESELKSVSSNVDTKKNNKKKEVLHYENMDLVEIKVDDPSEPVNSIKLEEIHQSDGTSLAESKQQPVRIVMKLPKLSTSSNLASDDTTDSPSSLKVESVQQDANPLKLKLKLNKEILTSTVLVENDIHSTDQIKEIETKKGLKSLVSNPNVEKPKKEKKKKKQYTKSQIDYKEESIDQVDDDNLEKSEDEEFMNAEDEIIKELKNSYADDDFGILEIFF